MMLVVFHDDVPIDIVYFLLIIYDYLHHYLQLTFLSI
jgi:hypothetical protein